MSPLLLIFSRFFQVFLNSFYFRLTLFADISWCLFFLSLFNLRILFIRSFAQTFSQTLQRLILYSFCFTTFVFYFKPCFYWRFHLLLSSFHNSLSLSLFFSVLFYIIFVFHIIKLSDFIHLFSFQFSCTFLVYSFFSSFAFWYFIALFNLLSVTIQISFFPFFLSFSCYISSFPFFYS